jgi:hypothetical protein
MNGTRELRVTFFGLALLLAACSSPSGPSEQAQAPAPEARPEAAETQAAAPTPLEQAPAAEEPAVAESTREPAAPSQETASTAATAPAAQTAATAPAPTAPVKTPPPAATPAAASSLVAAVPASTPNTAETKTVTPAPAMPALADPGGSIAVPAAKPGLKRIGAEACGECHEVQFDSWASSGHAERTPLLDCEDCHGPGSEYKPMSVMKDPAKARAAGLVMPDKAFCAQCHKKGVDDAFMKKAHAHEE